MHRPMLVEDFLRLRESLLSIMRMRASRTLGRA
jgi:hypothetical protein